MTQVKEAPSVELTPLDPSYFFRQGIIFMTQPHIPFEL